MKNSLLTPFLISCILLSCVSKKKYNELGQDYEHIENDLIRVQKEKKELEIELILRKKLHSFSEKLPLTYCKFKELSYDFGNVEIGKTYTHTFEYQNVGENPLIFVEVEGSCTCTAPNWTKELLKPNEKGELTISFTPDIPIGKQSKTIHIIANTRKQKLELTITAIVIDSSKK